MSSAVEAFQDPYLGQSWGELNAVRSVADDGDRLRVALALGYPARGLAGTLSRRLNEVVGKRVELSLAFEPPAASQGEQVPGVRNIIAVASGKGGVGKSTTAVNLALALALEGARVGVLDADIYGPSIGTMLGVAQGERPQVKEGHGGKVFVPVRTRHGVEAMSMSFLVTAETPMVWRGPMASGALQQMLGQTAWSDLDYLIVDMPPGTGDIQLTLAQRAAVAGAVIVTTPQELALQDARKGIEMFHKVSVPVLGVVENMGLHLCPNCGHASHIFGSGGGERVASEYDTVLLGALPLSSEIREQADSGGPTVAIDPEGPAALIYRECARFMAARLWGLSRGAAAAPQISIDDD